MPVGAKHARQLACRQGHLGGETAEWRVPRTLATSASNRGILTPCMPRRVGFFQDAVEDLEGWIGPNGQEPHPSVGERVRVPCPVCWEQGIVGGRERVNPWRGTAKRRQNLGHEVWEDLVIVTPARSRVAFHVPVGREVAYPGVCFWSPGR